MADRQAGAMARVASVVVAGRPHHVTPRGHRRQPTCFCRDDDHAFLVPMVERGAACGVKVWACCLMPHHVQLVAVPKIAEALAPRP